MSFSFTPLNRNLSGKEIFAREEINRIKCGFTCGESTIGALRDKFPFPLETTIERRGAFTNDYVAFVKNRRTGKPVAEVSMSNEGIFTVNRVAISKDAVSRVELAKTKDGSEGIFSHKRTTETYDIKNGALTHVTKMEKRGLFSQNCVAETTNKREPGTGKAVTRMKKIGSFFHSMSEYGCK
ncbi:hypothetical protein [Methanoregula formicica]|uniref:hypothetical protein n=1 Tax=Methanoregula formicica TaxID=882104 RepID=UPI0011D1980B|nr:hypothetical protein [Methanoregula formicica]